MIYFVRHGESEANVRKIFAGSQFDALLTETGKEQAFLAANNTLDKSISFDYIFSSPLVRAFETATIISKIINFQQGIKVDKRICDISLGEIAYKPYSFAEKFDGPLSGVGVETTEEIYKRVIDFLDYLKKDVEFIEKNILVVSHNNIANMIMTILSKGNLSEYYKYGGIENAKLIELDLKSL